MKVRKLFLSWFSAMKRAQKSDKQSKIKEAIGEMSGKSHLEDYLNYYRSLVSPGYAVLVTGEWGTGKTHQVKSCIPEDDQLYVSLFGVQTVDQLHAEVFAAAAPTLAKVDKMIGKGSDIVASIQGPWALAGAIPSLFNAVFKREIEPSKTLIFDDLERSKITFEDVLGAINSYVEQLGFRVVVIAHDEKLTDQFSQMREKTFGQSIRVEPQVEDALIYFINQIENPSARRFVQKHKPQIQNIFLSSSVKSLRILRHAVKDLARLHGSLNEKHLENDAAMDEMTKYFVAFGIEVRSGNLKEGDLHNRRGTRIMHMMQDRRNPPDGIEKPPLLVANDKYPEIDLEAGMLNDSVLISTLIYGRFHKAEICASIDNSPYFFVPKEVPPWKVIINFDELEDKDIDEARKRMDEQFDKREITDSGAMLHMFALRMMMAEHGIIDKPVEDVVRENKAYIEQLLKEGRLPARGTSYRWFDEFERSYDGFGYWVAENHADFFKETWDHLIASRELAFNKTIPDIIADLLNMIASDPKEFFEAVSPTNNGPNPYAFIPLLHEIVPKNFVDAWLSADRKDWRYVKYALENRYDSRQLEGALSPEREWVVQILKELDRRASEDTGFRALRIQRIRPNIRAELALVIEGGEA